MLTCTEPSHGPSMPRPWDGWPTLEVLKRKTQNIMAMAIHGQFGIYSASSTLVSSKSFHSQSCKVAAVPSPFPQELVAELQHRSLDGPAIAGPHMEALAPVLDANTNVCDPCTLDDTNMSS